LKQTEQLIDLATAYLQLVKDLLAVVGFETHHFVKPLVLVVLRECGATR
jgi:hypothetical protein